MITIEEIYKAVEINKHKYKYDEDLVQDLVIHIWTNMDKYDPTKGTVGTWMGTVIKFYYIQNQRLRKIQTTPMSYFEEDYSFDYFESSMSSNELSPIDELIYKEEQEEFFKSIENLSDIKQDIINNYIDGVARPKTKTEQQQLRRIVKTLEKKEEKYKFFLINVETKKELYFNTLVEVSEYLNVKAQTVSAAYRDKRIFKKKWRIIQK